MAKLNKGSKLACIPCGREVVVDCCGVSERTLWCCGKPMKAKAKRKPARKTVKRKKK